MIKTLESDLSASDFSGAELSDEEKLKVKVLYKKVCDMRAQGNMLKDAKGEKLPEHLQPGIAYNTLSLKPGLVEYADGKTENFEAEDANATHIRMLLNAYHI